MNAGVLWLVWSAFSPCARWKKVFARTAGSSVVGNTGPHYARSSCASTPLRSPAEKIVAMKQLEQISFGEMANFLKDNDQARFAM